MAMPDLVLHDFFNSSASYRVRIALGLKGLAWTHAGVNLRAGQQRSEAFTALNRAGMVPALQVGDATLTQSLAIVDHLDRLQPEPRLIPADGPDRDRVLQIALAIACDIHPLNNLRVLKHLTGPLALSEAQKSAWIEHWIAAGFDALEPTLPEHGADAGGSDWCVGDAPTLADCCLVPQVANARRSNIDIGRWPRIARIDAAARRHPAFAAAAPDRQPDYIPA